VNEKQRTYKMAKKTYTSSSSFCSLATLVSERLAFCSDFLTILSIPHLFPRLESTSKSKRSSFKGRRSSFKFGILPDRSDSTQSQPATIVAQMESFLCTISRSRRHSTIFPNGYEILTSTRPKMLREC